MDMEPLLCGGMPERDNTNRGGKKNRPELQYAVSAGGAVNRRPCFFIVYIFDNNGCYE